MIGCSFLINSIILRVLFAMHSSKLNLDLNTDVSAFGVEVGERGCH